MYNGKYTTWIELDVAIRIREHISNEFMKGFRNLWKGSVEPNPIVFKPGSESEIKITRFKNKISWFEQNF